MRKEETLALETSCCSLMSVLRSKSMGTMQSAFEQDLERWTNFHWPYRNAACELELAA